MVSSLLSPRPLQTLATLCTTTDHSTTEPFLLFVSRMISPLLSARPLQTLATLCTTTDDSATEPLLLLVAGQYFHFAALPPSRLLSARRPSPEPDTTPSRLTATAVTRGRRGRDAGSSPERPPTSPPPRPFLARGSRGRVADSGPSVPHLFLTPPALSPCHCPACVFFSRNFHFQQLTRGAGRDVAESPIVKADNAEATTPSIAPLHTQLPATDQWTRRLLML